MIEEQLKCPNCDQFKIITLQYRIDPYSNKRVSVVSGVYAKSSTGLLVVLGGIGLSMGLCIGLFETSLWGAPGFWLWNLAMIIAVVAGISVNKRYHGYKKEFDHVCQICGYKWTTSEKLSDNEKAVSSLSSPQILQSRNLGGEIYDNSIKPEKGDGAEEYHSLPKVTNSRKKSIVPVDNELDEQNIKNKEIENRKSVRYCQSCGKKVLASDHFCQFCGEQLRPL